MDFFFYICLLIYIDVYLLLFLKYVFILFLLDG